MAPVLPYPNSCSCPHWTYGDFVCKFSLMFRHASIILSKSASSLRTRVAHTSIRRSCRPSHRTLCLTTLCLHARAPAWWGANNINFQLLLNDLHFRLCYRSNDTKIAVFGLNPTEKIVVTISHRAYRKYFLRDTRLFELWKQKTLCVLCSVR